MPLRLPEGAKARFRTRSGKIEILNASVEPALPRLLPTHVDGERARAGAAGSRSKTATS